MILITGGLGYLGGRITHNLFRLGQPIRIGCSRQKPVLPKALKSCEVAQLNLDDSRSLNMACDGVKTIVHLAGMNSEMCKANPAKALMVNGMGTLNLIKAATEKGVKNFIYFSTVHVYGTPLNGILDETSILRPIHPYSITHRLAEDYLLEAISCGKMMGSVLRVSNAIGPPLTKEANCWMLVVNDLCRQVVRVKKMIFLSDRECKRDYIAIAAICNTVFSLIANDKLNDKCNGEIINITSGISTSLDELSKKISKRCKVVLGFTPQIEFHNSFNKISSEIQVISNKKAKELGIQLESNLTNEIDNLLLSCQKWYLC